MSPEIYVNGEGFVYMGGQKVARTYLGCGGVRMIETLDKRPDRAKQRGTRFVVVTWKEFTEVIATSYEQMGLDNEGKS